jgi:hypothetical protein
MNTNGAAAASIYFDESATLNLCEAIVSNAKGLGP